MDQATLYRVINDLYALLSALRDIAVAKGLGDFWIGLTFREEADGKAVATGELGEIVVYGSMVMSGYWQNPTATQKTLVDGGLRTGDVGCIDERGLLHLKDRSKDVIISGGTNIYPREVEDALLAHPAVKEVAVIGVPDQEWGEAVTAIVVLGEPVSESELDTLWTQSIARFKRPKRYVFVDKLPKNPTGRVLKNELRRLLINPD